MLTAVTKAFYSENELASAAKSDLTPTPRHLWKYTRFAMSRKLGSFRLVFLLCLGFSTTLLFPACENHSIRFNPADNDGIDLLEFADQENKLEVDIPEADLPETELSELDTLDGDVMDNELDAALELESESDLDSVMPEIEIEIEIEKEFESDGDLDSEKETVAELDLSEPDNKELESETEIVDGENNPFTTEKLPWSGLTLTDCDGKQSTDRLTYTVDVWSDDKGKVYFAGKQFWVLDENAQTLTCDPSMTEEQFGIDGKLVGDTSEIWVVLKDKIARKNADSWTFVSIPNTAGRAYPYPAEPPAALHFGPNSLLAVWGMWGIGFYNTQTEQWTYTGLCPGMKNNLILNGVWYEGKFWTSGGCSLYRLDPENPVCVTERTFDTCTAKTPSEIEVIGLTGSVLNLTEVFLEDKPETYGLLNYFLELDLSNGQLQSFSHPNVQPCKKERPDHCNPNVRLVVVPGMVGFPAVSVLLDYQGICPWGFYLGYLMVRFTPNISDSICNTSEDIGSLGSEDPWVGYPFQVAFQSSMKTRFWRGASQAWTTIGPTRIRWD